MKPRHPLRGPGVPLAAGLVVDAEGGGELIAGHVLVGRCATGETYRPEEALLVGAAGEADGEPVLAVCGRDEAFLLVGGALAVPLFEGGQLSATVFLEVAGVLDGGEGVGSLGFSRRRGRLGLRAAPALGPRLTIAMGVLS